MKRIITIALVAILLCAAKMSGVYAADTSHVGLAITPPTFDLTANPGDTMHNEIRVDNLTDSPLDLTTELRNFTALGEEGEVALTQENSSFSLASWITVSPQGVQVPAKGSQTFQFDIHVPSNAEAGGHFGSIVFKTAAKPFTGGSGLSVAQELGSLILLKVAGPVTERASIQSFAATPSFLEYGPATFETRIKNEGNVHIKPTGTITITDAFGTKVATIPVDAKNVLPGAVRKLTSTWQTKSLFGRYVATLSLQYGTNRPVLTASTSFIVVPWRMVLIVLIILAGLGTLIYLGRRRIIRSIRILVGKE